MGPFKSGKSALLNLIGGRLKRSVKIHGSMTINGKGLRQTWVRPTYVSSRDEALANVTVEQALVYTGVVCSRPLLLLAAETSMKASIIEEAEEREWGGGGGGGGAPRTRWWPMSPEGERVSDTYFKVPHCFVGTLQPH